jgi:outer membrane protein OmpA-like peptidoglycan-associated protein
VTAGAGHRPSALTFTTASALLAGLLAGLVSAAPAHAQTGGDPALVTDVEIAASIQTIDLDDAVIAIEVDESLVELRTEQRSGGDVEVSISADVLFAFASAELTDAARTEIGRIGAELHGAVGAVSVDGHTDNVGDATYNLTLSQRRADAVAELLRPAVAAGVTVTAVGHGSQDPVAENSLPDGSDNPDGRALNRRVTVTYRLPS